MARMRVKARGAAGQVETVEIEAASEVQAVRRAAAQGLRVMAIEPASPADGAGRAAAGFPLLLSSQELLSLLDAGLNLVEALGTLQAKERRPGVRMVLDGIVGTLREGRSFSDALAQSAHPFPAVYVATVQASERTGDLPRALERYVAYQGQLETLRKKLISAAIYPAMLVAVGGLVTLFLLGYVVPRFSAVYESSGREMPWMSMMLLAFGRLIHAHWEAVSAAAVGLGVAAVVAAARPSCRAAVLRGVLKLPWLSARTDEFRLARYYRAVSLLLAAGIALPRALGMVSGLLGAGQQAAAARCRQAVTEGQSLSAALLMAGLAGPVAESLIKVGERSGQMADMLERTARFADEDFGRWVDWASRLLEPALMTLIGIVIGTVVVLMYLPIFELAGSLQ